MISRWSAAAQVPDWLPLAAWPLLVLLALGGSAAGGAVAVACAVVAVAVGIVLTHLASDPAVPPADAHAPDA